MGGSTGTPPPPQPVLQYSGGPFPAPPGSVTPHPPVFAKPYMGSGMQALTGEQNVGPAINDNKDDSKRYLAAPVPPHPPPAHQLLARPVTFIQS